MSDDASAAPGAPRGSGTRRRRAVARLRSMGRSVSETVYRGIIAGSVPGAAVGILVSVLGLTVLGCMMVLSASSVEQISEAASPYTLFLRQSMYAGIGIVAMLLASRVPLAFWKNRKVALCLMAAALFLLMLVLTPLGRASGGNRNWLALGPVQFQPSELAKFAMLIWAAWGLTASTQVSRSVRKALLPSCLGFLAIVFFVMLGGDAGSCLVFVLIYAAALWFARAPRKIFTVSALAAALMGVVVVAASPARIQRVIGWLFPSRCGANETCYQSDAGLNALASGSWWGEGLGQSRQKYNYLPEAHNDYIFAILGEELGFIGAMVVIALFTVLAVSLARIILRSSDRFVRIAAGGVLAWFVGQAFVNIGMVTGLLPVIGIPLPFISYGGTSLVVSLATAGFAMSLSRGPTHPAIELRSLREDPPQPARVPADVN